MEQKVFSLNLRDVTLPSFSPNNLLVRGCDRINFLKKLEDLTNVRVEDIYLNDSKVLSLFSSLDALNITSEEFFYETGTLGLGIFDTRECDYLLKFLSPITLKDLINILRIDLTNLNKYSNIISFLENEKLVINYKKKMRMLTDEVIYAYILGFYKLYYPLEFYASLILIEEYDLSNLNILSEGYRSIRNKILEINDVDIKEEIKPKEKDIESIFFERLLSIALETVSRGFSFKSSKNIKNIKIDKDKKLIYYLGGCINE